MFRERAKIIGTVSLLLAMKPLKAPVGGEGKRCLMCSDVIMDDQLILDSHAIILFFS